MHIRTSLFAIAAVAVVSAAAATETPRAPGAYASLTAADPAACARACADDGICMAWGFYRENQCQLSAVVTAPGAPALAAGFASRAPAILQPRTPVVQPESVEEMPTQPPAAAPHTDDEPVAAAAAELDESMLLGGPGEGDLRLGLR